MASKLHYSLLAALLLAATSIASAQSAQPGRRLYPGFTAGWQATSIQYRGGTGGSFDGAWRGALVLDYEITRRLSLHTQLGAQYMRGLNLMTGEQPRLLYPELWVGFQEYLPVGGGSFYLNASLTAGSGLTLSGTDVFEQPAYKRFRFGWGALMGYLFRNGVYINGGLQSSFTNYQQAGPWGNAYQFAWHGLNVGFLFGNQQRQLARRR